MLWFIAYMIVGMVFVSWKVRKTARKIIIEKKFSETETNFFMIGVIIITVGLSFVWPIVLVFSSGKKKKVTEDKE